MIRPPLPPLSFRMYSMANLVPWITAFCTECKQHGIRSMSHTMLVSECFFFDTIQTARVIFTAKTSVDVFSLRRELVWTVSVLGDQIYGMRCLFVAVGLNALFIVLPHPDNMSHMLTHPVTLY